MLPNFKIFQKRNKKNKSDKFDILATNAGTYYVDLNKYNYIYITNAWKGYVQQGTFPLGCNFLPMSVFKKWNAMDNTYVEGDFQTLHMIHKVNITYDWNTKKLEVTGTNYNDMQPVVVGIY